ncbi:translation elongation factor Ts [Ferrimicrobium acidiphilum]|uniref:Elongation factor Ts n=1 Tax=Ferrimicrobium acidiphilum TaxID=121039 RepID=A0ABV3Y1N7_9ACTN
MAEIKAADVQALRKLTGAGILDAKKTLEETGGDAERAAQLLRERGVVSAAKRADRESSEGAIALSMVDNRVGALVELKCETDFVAKSTDFVNTVNEIAAAVAERGTSAADEFQEMIASLTITLKENISLGRVIRLEAADGEEVSGYLHVQADRGVNGVLVQLKNGSDELAHDLALHIAFARPSYLAIEDVPSSVVAKERETLETMTRNEGKPEAALEKIVAGRLDGLFKSICLLEQPFVKDEKHRIREVLGQATLIAFAQLVVGE